MDEDQIDQIAKQVGDAATRDEILTIANNREKKHAKMLLREGIFNEIEVDMLKKRLSFELFAPRMPHEFRSFLTAQELFVSGHYGPSCLYSRATLEYVLQEDCLAQDGKSACFDKLIEEINAPRRNPMIRTMRDELIDCGIWPAETKPLSETVIVNGDNIAHHRYDRIFKGKDFDKLRFQLPRAIEIRDDNGNIIDIEQDGHYERASYDVNRRFEERRMSFDSLDCLIQILMTCRPLIARSITPKSLSTST